MPAYNFKTWKAKLVESGESRQTIRPRRKRPTVSGDVLYLYHGQRTKSARLLRTETCLSVEPVEFGIRLAFGGAMNSPVVILGGKALTPKEIRELADADGFPNTALFLEFFRDHYGIPNNRSLELIKW